MGKAAKFLLLLAGRLGGLLNQYGGAAAAYSLRNLSTSTTNVVKVRRDSDDSEQDFTASDITNGTLLSFVNQSVEKIGNGDFSDGSTGWTVTNGSITGGQYVSGTLTAYQSGLRRTSFTYTGTGTLTFDLVVNSGSIRVDDGGGIKTYSSSGTQSVTLTNPTKIEFNAYNLGFDGTIDNVSFIPTNVDGFVTTWYDQSGNANNATQATAANQPKIVSSGTLVTENGKATLDFDGTDDYLSISNQIALADDSVISVVTKYDSGSPQGVLAVQGDTSAFKGMQLWIQSSKHNAYYGRTNAYAEIASTLTTNQVVFVLSKSGSTGYLMQDNLSENSVAYSSPDTSLRSYYIGTITSNQYRYNGNIQEIIIYDGNQFQNRSLIKSNINDYYNIYP